MTFTKKQWDEFPAGGVKKPWLSTVVIWIMPPALRLLMRIGFFRRYLSASRSARIGAISRCRDRGEHDKAVDMAIDALKAFRHRKPGWFFDNGHAHLIWWMFMRSAVVSLQESDDPEKWERIIALARDGIEPFEGYDVAYAFHAFSRRKFAARNHAAAVELATIAARADETWGEPDFLLGCYELASGSGNGLTHLSRAVRKDQKILIRIADSPNFRLHPHVIAKLTEISKDGLATGGDDAAPAED